MERLQRDLKYFELQLQGEENRERNVLILTQIKEIKLKMIEIEREEKETLQREITYIRKELIKKGIDPDSNKPK